MRASFWKSIAIAVGTAAVLLSPGYAAAAAPRHGARHETRYPQYNNPDAYRTGSSRWWEEMDRQDRGGR
jgi:hypothetical protein